ncbi:Hypothetical predicted protein, partial [Pelobates cultripes]
MAARSGKIPQLQHPSPPCSFRLFHRRSRHQNTPLTTAIQMRPGRNVFQNGEDLWGQVSNAPRG